MPVLVRNTEGGPFVFTDAVTKTVLEWKGAGDPTGEDVQSVPDALIENPAFMRNIQRGIIVVEEADDNAKALLDKQTASWTQRQEREKALSRASIDQQQNNDMVSAQCVGPNNRGNGQCGDLVPVKEKDKFGRPPLCPTHESLVNQFALVEDPDAGDESGKRTWVRTQVDARQRQS
jgi:hypothetical protein